MHGLRTIASTISTEAICHLATSTSWFVATGVAGRCKALFSTLIQIDPRLHYPSTVTSSSYWTSASPVYRSLALSLCARRHAKSRYPRGRLLVRAGRADCIGASGATVVLLPMRGLCVGHPGEAGSVTSTNVSLARYCLLRFVASRPL